MSYLVVAAHPGDAVTGTGMWNTWKEKLHKSCGMDKRMTEYLKV